MTVEQLQREYDALLAPEDMPGEWTRRQRDAYETHRCELGGHLRTARASLAILATVEPKIAADETWLAFENTTREQLCADLLACPRARTDLERGRVRNLELSIQCLDRGVRVLDDTGWGLAQTRLGEAMRAAGYPSAQLVENQAVPDTPFYGAIGVTEARLKDLRARRDDARARLEIALREPATVSS